MGELQAFGRVFGSGRVDVLGVRVLEGVFEVGELQAVLFGRFGRRN